MPLPIIRSDQLIKKFRRRPKLRASLKLESSGSRSTNVHRAKIWLIGFAVFATSVTVASIPLPPIAASRTLAARTPLASFPALTETVRLASRWGLATAPSFHIEQASAQRRATYPGSAHRFTSLLPPLPETMGAFTAQTGTIQAARSAVFRDEPNRNARPIPASHELTHALMMASDPVEIRPVYVTARIDRSLFEDAADAGLSDNLVLEIVQIFGWDIDFARDLSPGDRFTVIYEEKYWRGKKIAEGQIIAAEFVNRGQMYRAVRFTNADGNTEYYSVSGRSLRRSFLRTPVNFTRVSSIFAKARFHPVLKIWRAHNGIDYVAPVGTPVRATASGKVIWRGWSGSYGKTIVIDHGNAYSTLYGHLDDYRADLRSGQQVKQGAVVGYVGKSGLVTGPHLHYEFRVNNQHRDPLTFDFPRGEPVPETLRDEFLRTTRHWLSRLDLISGRTVAVR